MTCAYGVYFLKDNKGLQLVHKWKCEKMFFSKYTMKQNGCIGYSSLFIVPIKHTRDGPRLLTRFNLIPAQIHALWCGGWNYLSILDLQRAMRFVNGWLIPSRTLLGMWSMLGLKLVHVGKGGPRLLVMRTLTHNPTGNVVLILYTKTSRRCGDFFDKHINCYCV